MSFLDRFQGKIATVTAHGHLRNADGSEEIRVGPPKRKPQPRTTASAKEKGLPSTNNNNASHIATGGRSIDNNSSSNDNERQRERSRELPHYSQAMMPGQLVDEQYGSSERSSPASKSPSPVQERPPIERSSPRVLASTQSSEAARGSRSPKEVNEARVTSEHDQLAFSRKARPVSYEPCKLSQYKKEKPGGYYELGKLQPDLNSDDLVQKRANMERIKAFSKNLRVINKASPSAAKKACENNDSGSPKKPKSTRDKALEFAKRVPKPKARASTPEDDDGAPSQPYVSVLEPKTQSSARPPPNARGVAQKAPRPINSVVDDDSEDDELSSELLQLQRQHQQSRAQVDAIIGSG